MQLDNDQINPIASFAWSPDSTWIAFGERPLGSWSGFDITKTQVSSYARVYAAKADGCKSSLQELSKFEHRAKAEYTFDDWSPNDARILINYVDRSTYNDQAAPSPTNRVIIRPYFINPEGSQQREIDPSLVKGSFYGEVGGYSYWSPDGSLRLIRTSNLTPVFSNLYAVGNEGTSATLLNEEIIGTDIDGLSPRFSPNREYVFFRQEDRNAGRSNAWIANQDGSRRVKLNVGDGVVRGGSACSGLLTARRC